MKIITGNEFGKAVCVALGLEYKIVRRIVIDAEADHVTTVYVEYFGDERLLNIAPMLSGIEVKVVDTRKAESK